MGLVLNCKEQHIHSIHELVKILVARCFTTFDSSVLRLKSSKQMPDKTENQITNKFKINHWLKINVNESLEKNWQMCLLNLNLISIYPKLVASLSIFSEEQHWQRVANTRTESELIKFIDNLNQKHPIIKFEFTYSRTRITFLDTKVHKNENGTLRTTIYRKPSDCRKFFHYKSAQPKELKDSIPYNQALRIKRIC